MIGTLITLKIKGAKDLTKVVGAGVSQTIVPQLDLCRRGCGEGLMLWQSQRIKIALAITSELHHSSM